MISEALYDDICAKEPYRHKGMFYSEVYLFLQACSIEGVNLIIESGVKNGMSTRLLASAWHGEVIAIDRNPVALDAIFPAVRFLSGDSTKLLPHLLRQASERRVGVLIDGPKGSAARALKDACLALPATRLVAVHDIGSEPEQAWHSHDAAWGGLRERFDRFVEESYRRKYPKGPGLGIWRKDNS